MNARRNAQDSEDPVVLKQLGNEAFQRREYQIAIDHYAEAFRHVSLSDMEAQRTLLANRAQSYLLYGDIHTGLRDVELALAPQYTKPDSPAKLTAKCHFRRAKLLHMFARYDEAKRDYQAFKNIQSAQGFPINNAEVQLGADIEKSLNVKEGSKQWLKDQLMRAVDVRGLMLRDDHRQSFPLPPNEQRAVLMKDFEFEGTQLAFDTEDGMPLRTLPDPLKTPLAIPIYIRAPYFTPRPGYRGPFSTRNEEAVSENDTVDDVLEGLFMTFVTHEPSGGNMDDLERRKCWRGAMDHDNEAETVVKVMTSRGRMLIIPRSTRIKDIIAGARWPRQGPLAFEDVRAVPRHRDFECDGVELGMGCFMELYVIPKNRLEDHLAHLEMGFASMRTPI